MSAKIPSLHKALEANDELTKAVGLLIQDLQSVSGQDVEKYVSVTIAREAVQRASELNE